MPETVQDTLFRSLPEVYRREEKDGFTYQLLGLFAGVLDGLEEKVYGVHHQLNAARADPRFLPWLASWVALVLDETWEESKRRELIRRIVQLYTTRGTIEGIRRFVEIYTGIKPEIVEEYGDGWRIGVRSTVEVDTKIYGTWEENAHRFSVLVATFEEFDLERKAKVRERVLIEKPAHTELVHVGWFASFWQIGVRSTLGVDAKVGG
ncbi:MAG: phage tail protein [Actinobacteria bacterium]|nr:phage tail protein [Actinomycetota bacterium]